MIFYSIYLFALGASIAIWFEMASWELSCLFYVFFFLFFCSFHLVAIYVSAVCGLCDLDICAMRNLSSFFRRSKRKRKERQLKCWCTVDMVWSANKNKNPNILKYVRYFMYGHFFIVVMMRLHTWTYWSSYNVLKYICRISWRQVGKVYLVLEALIHLHIFCVCM